MRPLSPRRRAALSWRPAFALALGASLAVAPTRAEEPPPQGGFRQLVLTRAGRDASGRLLDRKLTITSAGVAELVTDGRGDECPSEGGRYEGRVDLKILEAIVLRSAKLLASPPEGAPPKDSAPTTVVLTRERGVGTLSKPDQPNADWRALETLLGRAIAALSPSRAVRMRILPGNKKNKIVVEFSLLGPNPVSLLLPKTASDAFWLQGRPSWELVYPSKGRPVQSMIALTPRMPVYRIALKVHKLRKNGKPEKSEAEKRAKKSKPKARKDKSRNANRTREIQGALIYHNDALRADPDSAREPILSLCARRQ